MGDAKQFRLALYNLLQGDLVTIIIISEEVLIPQRTQPTRDQYGRNALCKYAYISFWSTETILSNATVSHLKGNKETEISTDCGLVWNGI